MKKLLVIIATLFAFANTINAQSEVSAKDRKLSMGIGACFAPQAVYQIGIGAKKPEQVNGFFFTTTLATKKIGCSLFYSVGGHAVGMFAFGNIGSFSVYGVGSKNLSDSGRYYGVGGMYGLGSLKWFSASAFAELGYGASNITGERRGNAMISVGGFFNLNYDVF